MANTVTRLETSNYSLNKKIKDAIESYSNKQEMPEPNSDIVRLYQEKITKNYDVSRSKNEIENAVELLSIAYNATPIKAGEIRVKIAKIHQDVIRSQEDAELMMNKVVREAGRISKELTSIFSILKKSNEDQKKDFILNEFSDVIENIKTKASDIHDGLIEVAQSFGKISEETLNATSSSELVLSSEVKEREKAQQAIAEYEAKQASIENLLESLRESIKKYNKFAEEMSQKADTAEKRAFITQLVQIGAQTVAAVAGVVSMSMGGSAGMATRVSTSTIRNVTNQGKTGDESDDSESDENPAEIETSKANAQLDKAKAQDKVGELEKHIIDINDKIEKNKQEQQSTTKKAELEQLKNNLKQKQKELDNAKENLEELSNKLENLQKRLDKISKYASEVSKQQIESGNSFRNLQLDFLNKAEAYEKEKMKNDAELIQIKALLVSKASVHESIELTVKTLILSIKSLKQVKNILEEVAAFFKNFAAFLEEVSKDAEEQSKLINKAATSKTGRDSFAMQRAVEGINEFTISQCAEWYATEDLAKQFVDVFNSGWRMMNGMSGKYLGEQELKSYIVTAANRIEEIAKSREQAANAKVFHIKEYREKLNA
ncbi:hypothetical protein [Nostoc sp. FACHB-110]|uniref:hypothetical protein n=1 Tax=Nostoc sp. FACHB-110 TaxID=2692834 RepID=UPI0016894362|nr:hypothetical protein [Nostoc sp. FACHB-110]MBD2438785.1 hypothetical protein [Nostoc sp. FACHB-110]